MGVNIRLISRHRRVVEIMLALSNNVASSLRYPKPNAGVIFVSIVPGVTWLCDLIVPGSRRSRRLKLY
jgi:hypothetical protein